MEISVDDRGRVFVLRGDRGPYQVLSPDGTVEEAFTAPPPDWTDGDDGAYDAGYDDGVEAERERAASAQAKAKTPAVRTATTTGGRL